MKTAMCNFSTITATIKKLKHLTGQCADIIIIIMYLILWHRYNSS